MSLSLTEAGKLDATQVLASLGSPAGGLDAEEARRRLAQVGLNAVRSHGARPLAVLARQLNSPLLLLWWPRRWCRSASGSTPTRASSLPSSA
jgi:Mg2+-importing ATPase